MMSRILVFALTALAVAACGGAVEQPVDGTAPSSAPEPTLKSATTDAHLWGVWDLVALERDGDPDMEVHDILQLDVRADGVVVARRCGKQYYVQNTLIVRCGDEASYDCYYGTVSRDGESWRIELPDLPTSSSREKRTIETIVAGERMRVSYMMPRSEAGVFLRTVDDMRTATSQSYAVGNCKAASTASGG